MFLAGVAHPVERHLAKVEVASSSLVTRSIKKDHTFVWPGEQSKRVTRLVYISIPLGMEIKESPGPNPAINLTPAG